jgi:hypothetical protein
MPEQYHTTDKRTGLEVAITGQFPEPHEDRIRIARTANLFARLMSTILMTENDTERRERFSAIETQLEIADALNRQDKEEVGTLLRTTKQRMGISEEQLDDLARRVVDEINRYQQGDGPALDGPGPSGPLN